MTDELHGLGGRLPLRRPADLDEQARALTATLEEAWIPWAEAKPFQAKSEDGSYIGPFNVALYSPASSAAFIAFQTIEAKETSLDPRVREVVILSVGSVWRSAYELYAHKAVAAKVGFSADEIACLAAGEPCASLRPLEAVAQRIALRLSIDRRIADALYREAREAFGERGVVDIVVLAGSYMMVCALLNAFEIPAPSGG